MVSSFHQKLVVRWVLTDSFRLLFKKPVERDTGSLQGDKS